MHGFKNRAGWNDEHHIKTPCSRGGETIDSNLLLIDVYRHDAWHLLFSNQTLREIIAHLKNYCSTKDFLLSVNNYYKHPAFRLLFGSKPLNEIIALLLRIQHAKDSQRIRIKLAA
ncbi:MAG: hypothetical protein WCT42_00075 [Candidatus Paceibacterota bacterium]